MTMTPTRLRRCAAWAVLSPLLDEDALIEALWLQQQQMRGDAVSDIIRFVDQIADRHLFDAATRRKLYESYHHAMRRPADELPMDPWPLMQASAPESASRASAGPHIPATTPPPTAPFIAFAPPAAPTPAAAATPPESLPPETDADPASVVFAGLCAAMIHEVEARHRNSVTDLRDALFEQIERSRTARPLKSRLQAAWDAGTRSAWQIEAPEKTLADIVGQLYVALCESLGPVHADVILTTAVKRASQLPQASRFSPHRLI